MSQWWIASSGVNPASTSSSISRWSPNPATTSAISSGIEPGQQKAARLHKFPLELHFLLEKAQASRTFSALSEIRERTVR